VITEIDCFIRHSRRHHIYRYATWNIFSAWNVGVSITKWKDHRLKIHTSLFWDLSNRGCLWTYMIHLFVLLSCYYCSFLSYIHALNGQCTSVQSDPENRYNASLFFYFLFIPFFDNVAVDRGTTAVTSILSWKVLGNCQTSRLRWIMRRHFPLHPLYISL